MNSESWGVLERSTLSGLSTGNYDKPETTDLSDNDKGGVVSWREAIKQARRLFLDEKSRVETITKSGPTRSVDSYHQAYAASSLEELAKIKQPMASYVHEYLDKKTDEE